MTSTLAMDRLTALTLITTSPLPGTGEGSCSAVSTSGLPNCLHMIASTCSSWNDDGPSRCWRHARAFHARLPQSDGNAAAPAASNEHNNIAHGAKMKVEYEL